jgi:hypothetical protein
MNETTRRKEYTIEHVLYLAFELGDANWKLRFSIGPAQKPRRRKIEARDLWHSERKWFWRRGASTCPRLLR